MAVPFSEIREVHRERHNLSMVLVTDRGNFRIYHDKPQMAWILQNTTKKKVAIFKEHFGDCIMEFIGDYTPLKTPKKVNTAKIFATAV